MSEKLRQFLTETYDTNGYKYYSKIKKNFPIQVDDQDDNDILAEFCNIWVSVLSKNRLKIEISGAIPITQEIADLVEIYHGSADQVTGKVTITINPNQIEVLRDLASKIKDTSGIGDTIYSSNWNKISARTVSSLYRLMRVVKEYLKQRSTSLESA